MIGLYEWNEAVQNMISWIEEHLTDDLSLSELSRRIGYSPYYCSAKFHGIVGKTVRSYIAGRRLAQAALAIRDTGERILDIAVRYGYSSQEALTRAFVSAYGCTPASYRRRPRPVVLSNRQVVLSPEFYMGQGGYAMSEANLKNAEIRMEFIPAHGYIGIWDGAARGYGEFWKSRDCDGICGIIESMRHEADPVVGCHMAGWRRAQGEHRYFYGFGVPYEYQGAVPEGFELRRFPASYYLVFFHPPFDYLKDNGEVMGRVERLAWNYDLGARGYDCKKYAWNEEVCQCYQRHYPEVLGYEVLRPVKRLS